MEYFNCGIIGIIGIRDKRDDVFPYQKPGMIQCCCVSRVFISNLFHSITVLFKPF